MFSDLHKRAKKAGQPPGTATYTGEKKAVTPGISVIIYNEHDFHETTGAKFEDCFPITKENAVTWVNVDGLQDTALVKKIADQYNLHPLTVEDILNVEQRAKVEEFTDYLFVTLKILQWQYKTQNFSTEQLSLVVGKDFVLSFQESKTILFDTIRERLRNGGTQRLRQQGSDYLAYRLIDTVVDQYFLVLEGIGDQIEHIEEQIISNPKPQVVRTLYHLKRQILVLRKAIWPMREAISHLLQAEMNFITSFTRVYLRDLYDHTVQAIDTVETFRDMLSGILDIYLSSLTNRMNEIMKVLTIISTIFIPITFIASIYGMNFEHMPELHTRWGYPVALLSMLIVGILMLIYFRRKKWL